MSNMTDEYNSLESSGRSDDKFMSTMSSSNGFAEKYYTSSIKIDDFHLKAVIGRGSFGKVYCATKKDDNKTYAIKTLKKEMILQRDQMQNT
jgi:serine/threonine protein kinase